MSVLNLTGVDWKCINMSGSGTTSNFQKCPLGVGKNFVNLGTLDKYVSSQVVLKVWHVIPYVGL